MTDDILALLKMHDYFQGLSETTVMAVAEHIQVLQFETGQCVHPANEPLTWMGFLVRGRLKVIHFDAHGHEKLLRYLERGEQYGMLSGDLTGPWSASLIALEPSTVLSLDHELGMDLTLKYPDLRRRWRQTFAGKLRKIFLPDTPEQKRQIVTIFHESPTTRSLTDQLIRRLLALEEELCVLGDHPQWKPREDIPFCLLTEGDRRLSEMEMRRQLNLWPDANRIIADVDASVDPNWASQLVELSDHVLWFIRPEDEDSAVEHLRVIESKVPDWREKINIVWLLEREHVSPLASDLRALANRDFKITTVEVCSPRGTTVSAGLERLVHYLRGVQIGLALGGGAARGMAHLGVLKALEQQGIVVDRIAGTSVGAMTGIVYGSGLDPQHAAKRFAADLQPSWLFRMMPGGGYWYLLYKFRWGQFSRMLRRYLEHWTLEQLPVPCHSVTADLVGGQAVVREQGDAVNSILESINLPVLSAPICRDGQALVDGGLLNNIPADVLVSKGCNFVIAASVTAKMEHQVGRNNPNTPTEKMNPPGALQAILRGLLVQSHNMNSIGVEPADVMIEPDVTGFELSEFTRAVDMAAIGEKTAQEQIPKIKTLLTRMDGQLFRWD